jgi:hypothetical protein
MSLRLNGSTSGYTELDAGAVAGNNTIKMPTANGNAYQVLRNGATAGSLEFASISSTPSFEIFVSSSTWTCPAGVTAAIVGVVGGGGGGRSLNAGAPGGSGGLGIGLVSVTPGTVYTVTVGAGGLGDSTTGTAGGTSSFGPQGQTALISATGGSGGTASGVPGANGSCSSTAANLRRTISTYPIPYTDGASPKSDASFAAAVWSVSSTYLPGANGWGAASTASGGVGGVVTIQYWS